MIVREINEKDWQKLEVFLNRIKFLRLTHIAELGKNKVEEYNLHLIKEISKKDESKVLFSEDNGEITGIISYEFLPFDSSIYGINMAKIRFLFGKTKDICKKLINSLQDYLIEKGIKHVTIKIDSLDIKSASVINESGFNNITTLINFYFNFDKQQIIIQKKGFFVREADNNDIPILENLSKESFKPITRFYLDKNLPKEKTKEMYATWIRNSCLGFADKVFVCEYDNNIVGFITCEIKDYKEDLNLKEGVIGLIAVSREYRGKSIAKDLLYRSLKWFNDKVDYVMVGTESSNYPALKLYQDAGFKILCSESVFHITI